jgi:hypothetical protein
VSEVTEFNSNSHYREGVLDAEAALFESWGSLTDEDFVPK